MAYPSRKRNGLMGFIFKLPKKKILPHIKNTVAGSKSFMFRAFRIVKILGCKRRAISFDKEGHKARFTQKGNQVRLK